MAAPQTFAPQPEIQWEQDTPEITDGDCPVPGDWNGRPLAIRVEESNLNCVLRANCLFEGVR
jgi:hypothetical protein